jgi:hypothetical protein
VRWQEDQRLVCILLLQPLQRCPIDVKRPGPRVHRTKPAIIEQSKERDLDAHQGAEGSVRLLARVGQPLARLLGDDGKLSLKCLAVQHFMRDRAAAHQRHRVHF